MFHLKFFQKIKIFLFECSLFVVLFLVHDVPDHPVQLGMAVGKGPISFLPVEIESGEPIVVYKFIARFLDLAHQVRKAAGGAHADHKMNVVWHAI